MSRNMYCENLANDDRYDKHCYCQQIESFILAFRLAYLLLTLGHSNSQCQGRAHFDWKYLTNGDEQDKHY